MTTYTINRTSERFDDNERPHDRAYPHNDGWLIDLDDLDDLMTLAQDAGPLIVGAASDTRQRPHIEIYDGWRE